MISSVKPEDVRNYSDFEDVQTRNDAKLYVDISRAEQYVVNYTNNSFDDYEKIPEAIKTAVILLAELYAHNSHERTQTVKSESFDDYSYTAESSEISLDDLGLSALLDDYIIAEASGTVTMRLRKL